MVKPEQILIIEPHSELRFRGPFINIASTSYIKLTNPSTHYIYFKVKTTAPRRYCVRPNSGCVRPGEVTQITVTLQPIEFDPAEKNKHKFMVQAIVNDKTWDGLPFDVWEGVKQEDIMESKLKCIFEKFVTKTTTAESTVTTAPKTVALSALNNAFDGKTKAIGDSSVKSSPKGSGETEEKLIKAAQEVNQLREEESALRQENLQLKEDLLQLRNVLMVSETSLAVATATKPTSHVTSESSTNVISIFIAVVMVIIGYVLGKMI